MFQQGCFSLGKGWKVQHCMWMIWLIVKGIEIKRTLYILLKRKGFGMGMKVVLDQKDFIMVSRQAESMIFTVFFRSYCTW